MNKSKWLDSKTAVWYLSVCAANARKRGVPQNPVVNLKRSLSCKQAWRNKSKQEKVLHCAKLRKAWKSRKSTVTREELGRRISAGWSEESRKAASVRKKQEWKDPTRARQWKNSLRIRSSSLSYRDNLKNSYTPERRAKLASNLSRRRILQSHPNGCETHLFAVLDKNFPGVFRLNACSSGVVVADKVPDFVGITNPSLLVEFFGDYWHGPLVTGRSCEEEEKQRCAYFQSRGYKVAVIWEHELNDEDIVVDKINKILCVR